MGENVAREREMGGRDAEMLKDCPEAPPTRHSSRLRDQSADTLLGRRQVPNASKDRYEH